MSYEITSFLWKHKRVNKLFLRIAPKLHLWLYARTEWTIGQTFNDPPEEYYLSWKEYWKLIKGNSGYGA